MKNFVTLALLLIVINVKAQIGVGTTSPNSTLDVRGSMSLNYRAFSSATSAGSTDNILVFTGTSAAAITLPDATTCVGREYNIKNVSSNSSMLTINTTSSQTIDGLTSWTLSQMNKSIVVISNGTNWYAVIESLPGSTGTPWVQGGNNLGVQQNIGTTSNHHLPFITNNTEKMRLSNTGNLAIGVTTFDGTNPEKLLVDAGTTSSFNVISGKGSINNYLQLNIQNRSSGTAASSDVVATADNGNESVNFVDLGINSSNYSSSGILGGANRGYLYNTGNDFVIGNASTTRDLMFFTGGTATTNERMRIMANGNVGIGVSDPANQLVVKDEVEIRRVGSVSNLIFSNTAGSGDFRIGSDGEDIFWQGGGGRNLQMGSFWTTILTGDRQVSSFPAFSGATGLNVGVLVQGTRDVSVPLAIQANSGSQSANLTEWRNSSGTALDVIDETGRMAIGTSTFDGSNPEKLLVEAGNTSSFNVISGKGSINNYLQLNIQNRNSGTSASSDVVATADNGTESTNFIDMGINSSNYSSSGILGGANRAYIYATGKDFAIGNASFGEDLVFFTGGLATGNERMRITSTSVHPGQDNSYTLGRNGNRWSAVWSANGTIQTSDIRTKRNVHNLSYGLKEIMQMTPIAYNWKDDLSNSNKIGFIAQQMQSIIPEVVIGNEQTETLGMNYAELVPVLVKAIQEQQAQIEEMRKEIKELKRKH